MVLSRLSVSTLRVRSTVTSASIWVQIRDRSTGAPSADRARRLIAST
jgi:hypothetical protein